jgi:hypothetical protein
MRGLFTKACLQKVVADYVMMGQCSFQVVYSQDHNMIVEVQHIPVETLRAARANEDGDVEAYYYTKDWNAVSSRKETAVRIPHHWPRIGGMDFGWDHPQAHVQLAIDPDSATVYVTQAWKASKKQPFEAWQAVKAWAEGVPTAWPHDGNQHEKGSAKQQKDYYEEAGWEMLDEHSRWPDGGIGVEAGLMKLNELMMLGQFKVFDDLWEVLEEIREYHRKQTPNGMSVIVKTKDDLIDARRTAFMSARYAEQKGKLKKSANEYEDWEPPREANAMGY